MNNRLSHLKSRNNHRGFTLVETLVAMGIITIMITAFLAAFAPAVTGIKKSISAKEANRLASTLEYEMSVLRPNEVNDSDPYVPEEGKYGTSFEKAFEWIKGSGGAVNDGAILLYQYRGDPEHVRDDEDGTLEPFTGEDGFPGQDYVLQSVVRRVDNDYVAVELVPRVVEGRVFLVRMVQLIYNASGELIESTTPDKILDPRNSNLEKNYEDYPEAVIAFQAQVYVLKSNQEAYVKKVANELTKDNFPDILGRPIFTRNMAVRR